MKKLTTLILLILSGIIYTKTFKKKTGCVALGKDCDFTAWCCGSNVCKDYRCRAKGTKDNQERWANEKNNPGKKCDWFHHCPKYYNCVSHRCALSEKYINTTSTSF